MAPQCHCGEPSPSARGNCLELAVSLRTVAPARQHLAQFPLSFAPLSPYQPHEAAVGGLDWLAIIILRSFQYVFLRDAFHCLIS